MMYLCLSVFIRGKMYLCGFGHSGRVGWGAAGGGVYRFFFNLWMRFM